MKKQNVIFFLLLSSFLLIGCSDDDDNSLSNPLDLIVDEYDNIPVKVNTENSYTFTINAKDYTYFTEDALVFSTDSIVVTLTLTNASSSGSYFNLLNENGKEIVSETLNESKVTVDTDLIGLLPAKIIIALNDFTGQLTIVAAIMNE